MVKYLNYQEDLLEKCKRGIKGFTARSSCAPYKDCMKGGSKKYSAVAVIDMNNIKGTVRFTSINDRTTIRYNIVGLSSGYHGMHIHKCGDLTKGCDQDVSILIQQIVTMGTTF